MPTTVGLFGVAVQIEDFLTPASTIPLSSIPLQFLFEVIEGDGTCVDAPVYGPTVLPVESCIGVSPGSTFTTRITAIVSTPTRSIVSINTVSPIGLSTTPVQQVPGSADAYFVDVTFTSANLAQLQEIFCFVAEDSGGLTSNQRCIFLVTATSPPLATSATIDSNNLLTIIFDQPITIPTSPAGLVIITSLQTGLQLLSFNTSVDATLARGNTALLFQLPFSLGETVLVNVQRHVVETNTFCGVENDPTTIPVGRGPK
ncbi:Deleted in malignant brain tumors 1 protein [Apostichopus japonicus]|uniref:Deleted in malignant brain tumors 1 protein n=1 Tax=Stichopus japonicus TaxID=307972 RepID=A0A2G8LPX3_STIJA|nr:Deleted in malignant brain tumors 1 protein [Apostichopus japonicus]